MERTAKASRAAQTAQMKNEIAAISRDIELKLERMKARDEEFNRVQSQISANLENTERLLGMR